MDTGGETERRGEAGPLPSADDARTALEAAPAPPPGPPPARPSAVAPRRGTFASLHHKNFAMFWSAAVLSNTGGTMQMITIPYVVFSITNSTTWLGVSAAIAFIPTVLIGPVAGAVADRHSRRQVLQVTQAVQMVAAFALWGLWVSGHAPLGAILGCVAVSSTAGGLGIASWQAFVPSLVPPEDLMNAVRLNSIQFTVARSAGPMLAALVLTQIGPGAAFLGNAVTFVPVLIVLALIPDAPRAARAVRRSVAREFGDGLAYIRRHPSLFECVVNVLVLSSLSYAVVQLAPAIARDQLHVGKAGYGFLVTAYGVGSIISSFAVAAWGDRVARSTITLAGVATAVVAMVLLGLADGFWLGAVALFGIGVAQTVVAVTHTTTIQVQVNDHMRGRVLAVYLMAVQLGLPLGALVLGSVAASTGTRALALGAGVLLGGYLVFVLTGFGAMKALNRNRPFDDEPAPTT